MASTTNVNTTCQYAETNSNSNNPGTSQTTNIPCGEDCITSVSNAQVKIEILKNEQNKQKLFFKATETKFDTILANIQNSINVINTAVDANNQNDLKTVIENDRKLNNSNIQLMDSKIENFNNELQNRINNKADETLLQTDIDNLKTNSEIKINSTFTRLLNNITDIRADLLLQETKLSYLILNRSELDTKLNIISEITNLGTDENLNIINNLSNENKKTSDSVTALTTYFAKLKINLDVQLKAIDSLIKANENKIIDELTSRKLDVKNLNSDITKVEKTVAASLEVLRKDVDDFIATFALKEKNIKSNFSKITELVNNNYIKIFNMVEDETNARVNSNDTLEIKINTFVNQFNKDLKAIDYTKDFDNLDTKIKNAIKDMTVKNLANVDNFVKVYSKISTNEENIKLCKNDLLSRIDNAVSANTKNYDNLVQSFSKQTEVVSNKLLKVSTDISKIETEVINLKSQKDVGTSGTTSTTASSIQDQLTALQNSITNNISTINTLNANILNNKADVLKEVSDKNLITSSNVQEAIATANSALSLSNLNITNLKAYVKRLEDSIVTITAGANTDKVNLESLLTIIQNNKKDVAKNLTNLESQMKIGCNALDLRVTLLEKEITETNSTVKVNDKNIRVMIDNINKDFLSADAIKSTKINNLENRIDTNAGLITNNAIKFANELKVLAQSLKSKDNTIQTNVEAIKTNLIKDINANSTMLNSLKDSFSSVQVQLNNAIDQESNNRSLAIKNLDDKLVTETTNRIDSAKKLQDQITIQTNKLSSVLDGSTKAFDSLKEILDYVNQLSGEKETQFTKLIKDLKVFEKTSVDNLNKETDFRLKADDVLTKSISDESDLRIQSIAKATALITQEVKDRLNSIQELNTKIEKQKTNFNNLLHIQDSNLKSLTETVSDNLKSLTSLIDNTNTKLNTSVTTLLNKIAEVKATLQKNIDNTTTYIKKVEDTNKSEHAEINKKISTNTNDLNQFFGNYPKDKNTLKVIYDTIQNNVNDINTLISNNVIKAQQANDNLENKIKITTDELNKTLSSTINNLNTETTNRTFQDKQLDTKINDNKNTITQLTSDVNARIDSEINDRKNGDSLLNNTLLNEIDNRKTNVKKLTNDLNNLDKVVSDQDIKFTKDISNLSIKTEDNYKNNLNLILNEQTDRKAQDNILETAISKEINRSTSKDIEIEALANKNKDDISKIMADADTSLDSFKEVKDVINTNENKFNTRINSVEATSKESDISINTKIEKEISDRNQDTDGIKSTLNQEIVNRTTSTDKLAKTISDNEIKQSTINTNTTDSINTEIQTRIDNIKDLKADLNKEVNIRASNDQDIKNSMSKETNERLQADQDLSSRIQKNTESSKNFTASLDIEKKIRIAKDANLQTEIDAINKIIGNIFDGSSDNLNSFKEIVDFINKTDFTNDTNLINFSKTVYTNIDEIHTSITNEMNTRAGEDNLIRIQLNNEIRDRITAFKNLVQEFSNNKVQVQQINSKFKENVINTIDSNNAQTKAIIKTINDDFTNIRTLIAAVNTDLSTEVKDRKFYIGELRNDLDNIMSQVEDKYSIVTKNVTEAIYKLELSNKNYEGTVTGKLSKQDSKLSNIKLGISNNTDKINNVETDLKTLVNQESVIRITKDTDLQNNINALSTKVDNNLTSTDKKISTLDSKVESILKGSSVDTEEFQKIVNVLNSIDPNTDIIRNIKDDINLKISNVNADRTLNKHQLEEEIANIKQVALGLITSMTEDYTNKFNALKNSLISDIKNSNSKNSLEIDTLTTKLNNELSVRQGFYSSIKSYIDTSLHNESSVRSTNDNNLNLRIVKEIENRQNGILDLRKEIQNTIDLNSGSILDKFTTLSNSINKEITNRTFVTDTMMNTINSFINTNTDEINTFTKTINDKINTFSSTLGKGVVDYSDISTAVQAAFDKLDNIQQEVSKKIKEEIKNGNITGADATKMVDMANTNFDIKNLLNTIDARIKDIVVQESNRAQTKELDLEGKVIQLRDDTKNENGTNINLINTISSKINSMVNTKITDFKNILDTYNLNLKDNVSNLNKEVSLRTAQFSELDAKVVSNTSDISNTESKLNKLIIDNNNQTSSILGDASKIIDTKTSTIEKEFTNLSKNLNNSSKVMDTKIQDFQNMLLSLNNNEADLKTEVQDLKTIIEDVLKNSSVDLNSVQEIVNYIKQNDNDILKVQHDIITGTGLNDLGEFVTMLNSHYLKQSVSVYKCLDTLDEIIFSNDNSRIADIKKLTQNLDIEIQKRIDDVKNLNLKIDNMQKLLQAQISQNRSDIDVNTTAIKHLDSTLSTEITERTLTDNQMRNSIGLEKDNSLVLKDTNYIDNESVKNSLITLDTNLFNSNRNLQTQIGNLDNLNTKNKDNLVKAINETLDIAEHPRFGNSSAFDDAFILQNVQG